MFHKKFFMLAGSAILLASCNSMPKPDGKPLAVKSFEHLAPIPLNVQNIQIVDIEQDQVSGWPDHFYVPVDSWMKSYLDRRYQAFGGQENMTIRIDNISVRYEQKESENSVAGFLGVARVDSYIVDVALDLSITNPNDGALRGHKFTARRVINMMESVSIAEREKAQQKGLETMFKEIDSALMEIIKVQLRI